MTYSYVLLGGLLHERLAARLRLLALAVHQRQPVATAKYKEQGHSTVSDRLATFSKSVSLQELANIRCGMYEFVHISALSRHDVPKTNKIYARINK